MSSPSDDRIDREASSKKEAGKWDVSLGPDKAGVKNDSAKDVSPSPDKGGIKYDKAGIPADKAKYPDKAPIKPPDAKPLVLDQAGLKKDAYKIDAYKIDH